MRGDKRLGVSFAGYFGDAPRFALTIFEARQPRLKKSHPLWPKMSLPFLHQRLEHPSDEIRFLRGLPGDRSELITCTLRSVQRKAVLHYAPYPTLGGIPVYLIPSTSMIGH
jgi:hypothetical protein